MLPFPSFQHHSRYGRSRCSAVELVFFRYPFDDHSYCNLRILYGREPDKPSQRQGTSVRVNLSGSRLSGNREIIETGSARRSLLNGLNHSGHDGFVLRRGQG